MPQKHQTEETDSTTSYPTNFGVYPVNQYTCTVQCIHTAPGTLQTFSLTLVACPSSRQRGLIWLGIGFDQNWVHQGAPGVYQFLEDDLSISGCAWLARDAGERSWGHTHV